MFEKSLLLLCFCAFLAAPVSADVILHSDETGINSDVDHCLSFRYHRHIWEASDGTYAAAIQQGGNSGYQLELWTSSDKGVTWTHNCQIRNAGDCISDGVIDGDDNIHMVVFGGEGGVIYRKLNYNASLKEWTPETVTVLSAGTDYTFSMASITLDSKDNVWMAVRRRDTVPTEIYYIEIYFFHKGAFHKAAELGDKNSNSQKNAKLFSYIDPAGVARTGCLWHEDDGTTSFVRSKKFAFREDSWHPSTAWEADGTMTLKDTDRSLDVYGTHWCVIPDDRGILHLVYQDEDELSDDPRMYYASYDGTAWTTPVKGVTEPGAYCALAQNGRKLYWFNSQTSDLGQRVVYKSMRLGDPQSWTDWMPLSPIPTGYWQGKVRMSCIEAFDDDIPVIFMKAGLGVKDIYYCLLKTNLYFKLWK